MIASPTKYERLLCLYCKSTLTIYRGGRHTTAEWKEVKRRHRDWLRTHQGFECQEVEKRETEITL